MSELKLDDWRDVSTAPKDATWIEVKQRNGLVWAAHWAQDLTGEEQPVFSGWFVFDGPRGFRELSHIAAWRPLDPDKAIRAGGNVVCDRCHYKYYDHPPFKGVWEDVPYAGFYGDHRHYFLNLICDGSIVKL